MTDETTLLPCPFCGGEAGTHETIDGWIVACSSEQSELDGFTHNAQAYGDTEAEAVAAWNTRAERTCRIVEYADAPIPVCSECGAVQPDDYAVYYCWSCGAKVRDE